MILRKIDFGPILCASGAQGFFGEKYWHQKIMGPFGPNFKGCTFVSKTTTLNKNIGNMPMKEDGITPKEWKPKCIKVYFNKGIMLNAVKLSGPGAEALFEDGRWQKRTAPFGISFMAIGRTREERLGETKKFAELFAGYLHGFKAKVFLQQNFTCSNIGLDLDGIADETNDSLDATSILGIPIMPKFNVLTPVKVVKKVTEHPACDAICVSNAIHWDDLPKAGIDRMELFGTDVSPLAEFGGGALSGKPLLPLVIDWIRKARFEGIRKPINAGGGILCPNDVSKLWLVNTNSVFIGSVATLRPWRVGKIIKRARLNFH